MGHGFNYTICPQPLGWDDRHKASAAAVIVQRAESLTEVQIEAIEAATGNDDPTTYVDAILIAWDAVVADQDWPFPLIASFDFAESETWHAGRFWLSGDIGDHNVEQEHLTLLRESGVCDEPMPWYEAPAVTCGYPVPTGVPETTPCELGRWHRGDEHKVTLDHATVTVTDSNAPAGAGPWPPVVVVTRDSEGGVAYAKERHMTDTTTTKPDTEVMPTTAIPSVMETEDHAAAGYYRICTSVRVGETWVCVEGFAHFDNQAEADAAAARVKVEVFA